MPSRVGKALALLRTFIAYGRNLTDTLRQHAADPRLLPCFAHLAITFVTGDVALILARVARGLLRAAALEERLRQRAARGQDLRDPDHTHPRKPRNPRARTKPAARLHDPARDPSLESPPTLEQIAAEDRRRPIGAVLVDICLDLGIVPGQMDPATWNELRRHIFQYGGSLVTFISGRDSRRQLGNPIPSGVSLLRDSAGRPIIVHPKWPTPPEAEKPPPPAGGGWGTGPGP